MGKFLFLLIFLTSFIFAEISFPGRGVNLGNWLDAPAKKDKSLDGTSEWGVKIDSADFVNIAQKGFNNIRIPARFSDYLTNENRVSQEFMNKVKWAVNQTIANGMVAIIDVHHFEGMVTDAEAYFPILKNIWEDISTAFKDYPDNNVLFELMNEPNASTTIELWNKYPVQLIEIIRKTNPTRPIVLGTADWGGFNTLKALKIPDDENLIITLHYYSPMKFTHQGADWSEGGMDWLGTRWTGTPIQKLAMKQDFQEVADYAKEKNFKIHIGEFGAYNPANYQDRVLWTKYVAELCNHFGFAFSYWEYSAGFGLFNPVKKEWFEELTAALFSTEKISDKDFLLSDENLIKNPNFANGKSNWNYGVWQPETGAATFEFTNGGLLVNVTKVPADVWGIQVIQANLPLVAGKAYLLSFDVLGDEEMSFYTCVESDTDYVNFGGITANGTAKNINAIIQVEETKYPVSLIFNFGYSTGEVVISNVSLREIITENTPIIEQNKKTNAVKNQKTFISKNTINTAPFSEFEIISANGKVLVKGTCDANGKAKIKDLPKGVYVINIKSSIGLKYLQK